MTEDDIKASHHQLIGDVYLLARSSIESDHYAYHRRLHWTPVTSILVYDDVCPYCGAPFIGYQCNGPGGWPYRGFACGSMAAFRNNGGCKLLLAISKPTTECGTMSDDRHDDVI